LALYAGTGEKMRISSAGDATFSNRITATKMITSNFGGSSNGALSLNGAGGVGEANIVNFGFDGGTFQPAYIGYVCTLGSNSTNGALIFGTRTGTVGTDQPIERMRIASGGVIQQQDHNWSFAVSKTYTSAFDMFDVECDVGAFAAFTVKIAGSKRSPGSNDHVGIKEYSCYKTAGANNWVVTEEISRGVNNDITFQVNTTKVTFISPFAGNNNFCYYSVTVIGTARVASNKSDLRVISYGD